VIKPKEGVDLQNFYESVLNGYTYMDVEKQAKLAMAAEELSRAGAGSSSNTNSMGEVHLFPGQN